MKIQPNLFFDTLFQVNADDSLYKPSESEENDEGYLVPDDESNPIVLKVSQEDEESVSNVSDENYSDDEGTESDNISD